MFNKARLELLRLLSLVGMVSIVGSAACEGGSACAQFDGELNERREECGQEPFDFEEDPDGCTDADARRSECFGDCLEAYPSCSALSVSTPEGEAVADCWGQCLVEHP